MNIQLTKVINFNEFLTKIQSYEMSISLAYKIYSMAEEIDKENKFYYEKLQKIISEYAKKDDEGEYQMSEDGTQILIKEECIEQCNKEMEELNTCEVELNIQKLQLKELEAIPELKLTLAELASIKDFIEE